jgi:hypothetical protein
VRKWRGKVMVWLLGEGARKCLGLLQIRIRIRIQIQAQIRIQGEEGNGSEGSGVASAQGRGKTHSARSGFRARHGLAVRVMVWHLSRPRGNALGLPIFGFRFRSGLTFGAMDGMIVKVIVWHLGKAAGKMHSAQFNLTFRRAFRAGREWQ